MGEPVSALDFVGPWTIDDLAQVTDELHKYEIVDGSLVVSPPPSLFHQAVARRLFGALVRQAPGDWEAVYELALREGDTTLIPDLGLVRVGLPTPRGAYGYDPANVGLAVEVLSPSSRTMDRVLKPARYGAAGVPWYWRVENDPDVVVFAYELVDGVYVERCRLQGAGVVPGPFLVELDTAVLGGTSP